MWVPLVAQMVRGLPAVQQTRVQLPSPWRREWQPTPVLFTEESQGQRSLVGYNPWITESDTTEQLPHTHTHTHVMSNRQLDGAQKSASAGGKDLEKSSV